MKKRSILLIIALFVLAFPIPARADGIIITEPICVDGPCPPPPCPPVPDGDTLPRPCPPVPRPAMAQLDIRYHHVTVKIQDQVVVTHVDQVFYNPNDWPVEGTYLFPLPKDAAVSSFTLWIDGAPVEGVVLDAQQARQTYEDIVHNLQDPALLEYADRGAVQASNFPIPPEGERRIELEYSQVLTADGGLVRYVYPLSTEKFSAMPLENVTINMEIVSSVPIRAAYSPSHEVGIDRQDPGRIKVGYEAADILPTDDFILDYSIGEREAFHLMTFRDPSDPSDPDGFFLLLLAPRPNAEAQAVPKDVILVLDRSGSMEGEKFQQAQEALRYILTHLNPEDRFNIVSFSTGVETYAPGLRPAGDAKEALPWVERLSAEGSTDINRALLESAALVETEGAERPAYLIFLTDGLPTEGEVDSQKILDNLAGAAPDQLRLFAFGVGYDVDTFLLDSLAQNHHGSSAYLAPGERLDEVLSGFYARISTPVLTDLELDFGDLPVYDIYPSPLPDLFVGSQILIAGRYREGGETTVTLSGTVDGQRQTFHYYDQVFESQSIFSNLQSPISRLWATRKIGYLLNQVRLTGPNPEIVDQIVRLSIRFGIVTPYTSYLVTEPLPLGAEEQERIATEQYNQLQAEAAAPASGQAAVQKASDQGALSAAEAPAASAEDTAERIRTVGSRTFIFSDGTWIDTGFDPQTAQTKKVAFLSEDYFALAEARPDLAAAFALGQKVIAQSGGDFYEVVGPGADGDPVQIQTSITSEETAIVPPTTAAESTPVAVEVQPAAGGKGSSAGSLPCLGPIGLLPLVAILLLSRKSSWFREL